LGSDKAIKHDRGDIVVLTVPFVAFGLYCAILAYYDYFYFLGDGYIFLRYAENIANHGLWGVNLDRDTYGFSSPLWLMLIAALKQLFPGKESFAIGAAVMGIGFHLSAVWFLATVLRWLSVPGLGRAVAASIYCLWPLGGIVYSMSAMETGLYLWLFCWVLYLLKGVISAHDKWSVSLLGIGLGLLAITRIEGVFLGLAIGFASVVNVVLAKGQRGELRRLFRVVVFAAIPNLCWYLFAYVKFGSVLPWSSRGRLYGYIGAVFSDISLNDYIAWSLFDKIAAIPTVVQSQFFSHPVVLLHGGLFLVLVVSLWTAFHRSHSVSENYKYFFGVLTIYSVLNMAVYLLFQPFIFQRYLIGLYPIALLMTFYGMTHWRVWRFSFSKPAILVCSLTAIILAYTTTFFPYYEFGSRQSREIVETIKQLREDTTGRIVIAAEPLGTASYYLAPDDMFHDLGGLIDHDIFEVWLSEKGDEVPFPAVGGDASITYGAKLGAEYFVLRESSYIPADLRFENLYGPKPHTRVVVARLKR
jgi:hypothetical protein